MPRLLSELIREGATRRPQALGLLYAGPEIAAACVRLGEDAARAAEVGCTCALGAAQEAAGWSLDEIGPADDLWPEGWATNHAQAKTLSWVWGKNDTLAELWTREAIADWLVESGRDFEVPLRSEVAP